MGLTDTGAGPAIIFGAWSWGSRAYPVVIAQPKKAQPRFASDWRITALDRNFHLEWNDEGHDYFDVLNANGCPAASYFARPLNRTAIWPQNDLVVMYSQAKSPSPAGPDDWSSVPLPQGADWVGYGPVYCSLVAGRPVLSAFGGLRSGNRVDPTIKVAWAITAAPESPTDWNFFDFPSVEDFDSALTFVDLLGRPAAAFMGDPALGFGGYPKGYMAVLANGAAPATPWAITPVCYGSSGKPLLAVSEDSIYLLYAKADALLLARAAIAECQNPAGWETSTVVSGALCDPVWLGLIGGEPAVFYQIEHASEQRHAGLYYARPAHGKWQDEDDWLRVRLRKHWLWYYAAAIGGRPAFAAFTYSPEPHIFYTWADSEQPISRNDWHTCTVFAREMKPKKPAGAGSDQGTAGAVSCVTVMAAPTV